MNIEEKNNQPVDIVIPWVDGGDSSWQNEKAKYEPKEKDSANDARYRDWDNLQYWFRSIEKYAPWVHKIHFVTWDHIPTWLNVNHPKLNIVNHRDYIPEKYLPTFSSHTIELNLHRIKDLSENFIYFNDDFYLNCPVKETDFFCDGLPTDIAALNVHCYFLENPIQMVAIRDVGVINSHFDMKKQIKVNRNKWFNPQYGSLLLRTLALMTCPRFPGFYIAHTPQPYNKSTFTEVWDAEYEILDQTCRHKFREMTDVNQWVMKEWQIAKGAFMPRKKSFSRPFFLGVAAKNRRQVAEQAADVIRNSSIQTICINDGKMPYEDFLYCKEVVNMAFQEKFPDKCSFER